ncbi:MAG: hypothetical protein O3B01_00500 [Planctomycetota bacterium]|nr:hypothetical protein [Planctomycetota bacterium]
MPIHVGSDIQALSFEDFIGALIGKGASPLKVKRIVDDRMTGHVSLRLLDEVTALEITAMTESPSTYELQLRKLLDHTNLEALEWVNLSRHRVSFKTLPR